MQPIIVDREVQLRLLEREHAAALFALTDRNRAYLREWLPWLDSVRVVSDTEGFIGKTLHMFAEAKIVTLGVWWQDRLVGVIGHDKTDWDNRFTHIGYWLSADCQGKGVMTRSCRAVVHHAFETLNLNRVEIGTAVGNHRSESIPRRLGFTHEGVRRQSEWLYDRFVDINIFAMLRSTWQLRNAMTSI